MKLYRCLVLGLLLVTLAAPAEGQPQPAEPKRYDDPLYPIRRGFRWHYRATDVKAAKSETPVKPALVVVTADNEQTFGLKKKDKEKEWTEEVIGYNLQVFGAGKIQSEQVLVSNDGVYRVSGAGKSISPPLRILKFNAGKSDSWKCDSQSENAVLKGTFIVDAEDVQVPLGLYKQAVVVRTKDFQIGAQRMQLETWYSAGVGMVKQRIQVGNHDMILELEKFEQLK